MMAWKEIGKEMAGPSEIILLGLHALLVSLLGFKVRGILVGCSES